MDTTLGPGQKFLKSVIMQTPFSFSWRMLIYIKMVVYVDSIE